MAIQNFTSELAPRANYPLARRVGDWVYISGLSARQPDGSFRGAHADAMGTVTLDIAEQTEGVIDNLRRALALANAGLADLAQLNCYLVNMNDFGGFNAVYNRYFTQATGPTRTTLAVHQLPHPHLLVEINGVAFSPA